MSPERRKRKTLEMKKIRELEYEAQKKNTNEAELENKRFRS